MILMLHTKLNPLHCTRHPHMLAAVHAVHTRLVRPAAALLPGLGSGTLAAAPPPPQQLPSTCRPCSWGWGCCCPA